VHFLVTVAVLVTAPPSGGAAAHLGEARAALVAAESARGLDVIDDPFALVANGWRAEAQLGFFGEAARLVADGQRKLARVELEAAEQAFAAAEKLYQEHRALPGVCTAWAEAAKWRGVALYELKRRDEARSEFGLAKGLDRATELTEAMVRPEVARAFAATPLAYEDMPADPGTFPGAGEPKQPTPPSLTEMMSTLGVNATIEAAIAVDRGQLVYAATRREASCMTDVATGARADELVRRLDSLPCRAGAEVSVEQAPEIAHPRPAPLATAQKPTASPRYARAPVERRPAVWRKPWLWVGVVGALGVGVVLAASLWPREPTWSLSAGYGSFALGAR
jgi:hypothetical protein